MGAAAKTVTANYVIQYYITVTSAKDTPTASAWVIAGEHFTASVTSPDGDASHQWVCTGYAIDGGASTPDTSYEFVDVAASHTIVFSWQEQWYLIVVTDPLGITTIAGEGWKNAGTVVSLKANDVYGYTFLKWDVDSVDRAQWLKKITVTMNGPHTATAHYYTWTTVSGYKYNDLDGSQPTTNPLQGWEMRLYSLQDDFNDGNKDGWITYSGTWAVESEELSGQSSGSEAWIWYSQPFSGDITIEFGMKFLTTPVDGVGRHGGVMSFSADETQRYATDGYTIDWIDRPGDHGFRVHKWVNGARTLLGVIGGSYNLVDGQWYDWKVVKDNKEISLYIDGAYVGMVTDPGTPYVSGYVGFWLYSNGEHAHFDDVSIYSSDVTDASGYYEIPVTQPGTYTLDEVLKSGWTKTFPVAAYPITASASDIIGKNFWNFQWLTVYGHKYVDGTTTGLSDWHMQLYKGGSQYGSDAVTDSNGAYSFTVKDPGTYSIKEVLKDKWTETSPVLTYSPGDGSTPSVLGYSDIAVTSGTDVSDKDFENFQWTTVSGVIKNTSGNFLSGWTIELYGSGGLYASTTTAASTGAYSFTVKDPGTYSIKEVLKDKWTETSPILTYSPGDGSTPSVLGYDGVVVGSGATITGKDFTNFKWLTVSGHKYEYGFCDNFEDGDASGWTPVNGVWTVVDESGNKVYEQSYPYYIPGVRVAGDSSWTDYVIQAKVKVTGTTSGRWGGILFRVHNPGTAGTAGTYYELYLQENGNLQLVKTVAGTRTGIVNPFVGSFYNEWWNIKAEVIGSHIRGKAWEVGTPEPSTWIIDWTDPSPILNGKIGLITFSNVANQPVYFDDICLKVPLAGWNMKLYSGSTEYASDTTDGYGAYSFTVKDPGTYSIKEVLPSGWTEVSPEHHYGDGSEVLGYSDMTVTSGTDVSGKDFTNFQWLTVSGVKKDTSGNFLSGWTIELYGSGGLYASTTTATSTGAYSFTVKDPGTFSIIEVLKAGWTATSPTYKVSDAANTMEVGYTFTTVSGTNIPDQDFTNFQWLTISGVKKNTEGNGLQGWTIKLYDSGGLYASTTTAASTGAYSFTVKDPGTYSIKEVLPSGWTEVSPEHHIGDGSEVLGYSDITVSSGTDVTGKGFTNFKNFVVSGYKYEQIFADDFSEADGPAIGWVVHDLLSLGDSNVWSVKGQVYTQDGTMGQSYTFPTTGDESWTDYILDLDIQPQSGIGDSLTFVGACFRVTLGATPPTSTHCYWAGITGDNSIEVWRLDSGGTTWTKLMDWPGHNLDYNWHHLKISAIGNTFTISWDGAILGTVVDSTYSHGNIGLHTAYYRYVKANFDNAKLEKPLNGWNIILTNPDATTVTATTGDGAWADGYYEFTITSPGDYSISETLKAGWTKISPTSDYIFTATSGHADVTGKDFVNFKWLTVSGVKFFDANGDDTKDPSESGLNNWLITLTKEGGSSSSITTATVDSVQGYYEFTIKEPGAYSLSETQKPPMWIQTTPPDNEFSFTAVSGHDEEVNFGNWLGGSSFVSTSSLSYFDVDNDAKNGRQFKLIFTPDTASSWKLPGSNPGQFFYNVFNIGSFDTVTITIPYPFVTQGAVPIHIYSSLDTDASGNLIPGNDVTSQFNIGTLPSTVSSPNYDGFGDTATVVITPKTSYSGFAYIAVHLDYGLKKTTGYAKDTSNNAVNPADYLDIWIANDYPYGFSVTGDVSDTQTIRNMNVFKRDPGFGGLVTNSNSDPVKGVKVQIYDPSGKLLATVYTDEDGWYMYQYKWTGKAATFTLKLPDYNLKQSVSLKANGFLVVNFTVP